VKIPVGFTEVTIASTYISQNVIKKHAEGRKAYCLPSERLPYDCAIFDGIFGMSTTRYHSSIANIHHVHDTNDEMITRTSSLFFFVQAVDQVFLDIGSEKGGVEGDDFGFLFEEEHSLCFRGG
jgi:hypothetical protein